MLKTIKKGSLPALKQTAWMLVGASLAGTAVIAQDAPTNRPAEDDGETEDAVQLQDVTVRAASLDASGPIATEASSSSKLDLPLAEIPRSVSVIPRERIELRGAQSIQDTLTYTPGVHAGPYGFDSRLDSATVRGVSPLKYLDGFQTLFGFYNNTRSDIYALESVEVIKGPASVLYGQGALGGIVNSVSKLPEAVAQREVEIQYGSHDRKQAAIDLTGPIDEDGKFLYRMVGLYRDSDTQVNHVPDDAIVVSPSITWAPAERTSLTFLVNVQANDGGQSLQFLPNEGTLLPGRKIPYDTFIGEPGWDKYDTRQQAYSVFFDHALNEIFSVDANARYTDGDAHYRSHWVAYDGADPLIAPDGTVNRTIYDSLATTEALVANASLNAEFATGGVEHRATGGVDFQRSEIDNDNYYGFGAGGRINIYDPVYGNLAPVPSRTDYPSETLTQWGLFMRDQLKFQRWILSLGARRDDVESKTEGVAGHPTDVAEVTGDVGLMYQFDAGFSPYASWAQSFEPLGSDGVGNQLEPKQGRQYEVGVKYQPPGTRSIFTAAVFDIHESNRPFADGPLTVYQGEANIRGVELEGQIEYRDIYLQLGYSYLDAKYEEGANEYHLVTVPDHQAVAWITYRPSGGFLEGFRGGFGVRHAGERWDGSDTLSADPYTLMDAMIGYEFGQFDVQLNVLNLADKEFVASTQGGRSFLGAKRSINLSASYQF